MTLYFLKLFILGVLIPIFDTGSDIFNAYNFYEKGDFWWSGFTIFFILLPGLMEFFYWIISYIFNRNTSFKEATYYSLVFGPFLFPIATPIWQIVHAFKGTQYSKSMVFKSLEAFLESAPQLLLQLTILIIKWSHISNHIAQLVSVASSSIFLSLTSVEHHLHELSGKKLVPKFKDIASSAPFFLLNALLRTFLIAVIIAYFKWWSVFFISGLIIINFVSAVLILKTERAKDLWTSVSSTLGLACFVSSLDIRSEILPSIIFYRYFLANVISCALVSVGVISGLSVLLQNEMLNYSCHDLPVFSCYNYSTIKDLEHKNGGCAFRRECEIGEGPHDFFIYTIVPVWSGLMACHIIIVCLMKWLCPSLMNNQTVGQMV
uniref:XK-related protein n=1 Tax=Lepeophtheirus salmonis TaxID=72036 RepID=A0A0K2T5U7_LEPSM